MILGTEKNPWLILHNPGDPESERLVANRPENCCVLTWYGSSAQETVRNFVHALSGYHYCWIYDPEQPTYEFAWMWREKYHHDFGLIDEDPEYPILPWVQYTDEQIASGDYPVEFTRWIRSCDNRSCKSHDHQYIGPPPSAFPSIVAILPNGTYGLWKRPPSIEWCSEANVSYSCLPDSCLAGQWVKGNYDREAGKLHGVIETAKSPWYSNRIMNEATRRFVRQMAHTSVEKKLKQAINCVSIRSDDLTKINKLRSLLILPVRLAATELDYLINTFWELAILRDDDGLDRCA